MPKRKQKRTHRVWQALVRRTTFGPLPAIPKDQIATGLEHIECPSCKRVWLELIDKDPKTIEDRKLVGGRCVNMRADKGAPQGIYIITMRGSSAHREYPHPPKLLYYQCPRCNAQWMHDVPTNVMCQWA
jgi:Zn-finger nucleic acid-binding protein